MPSETKAPIQDIENHILNTGITYGTVTDTMAAIKTGKKSRHLNTIE
jgi:hypothetical protein